MPVSAIVESCSLQRDRFARCARERTTEDGEPELVDHHPDDQGAQVLPAALQFWPGQIDMTRDLLPVIARPPEQSHMRFILGCVGIPWATFCGSFAARNVLGEADEDYKKYFNYFSNQRRFTLPSGLGKVIGKPLLFSLANSWAKFKQVDTLREHEQAEKEF
jgi:hypothetical protein